MYGFHKINRVGGISSLLSCGYAKDTIRRLRALNAHQLMRKHGSFRTQSFCAVGETSLKTSNGNRSSKISPRSNSASSFRRRWHHNSRGCVKSTSELRRSSNGRNAKSQSWLVLSSVCGTWWKECYLANVSAHLILSLFL